MCSCKPLRAPTHIGREVQACHEHTVQQSQNKLSVVHEPGTTQPRLPTRDRGALPLPSSPSPRYQHGSGICT